MGWLTNKRRRQSQSLVFVSSLDASSSDTNSSLAPSRSQLTVQGDGDQVLSDGFRLELVQRFAEHLAQRLDPSRLRRRTLLIEFSAVRDEGVEFVDEEDVVEGFGEGLVEEEGAEDEVDDL